MSLTIKISGSDYHYGGDEKVQESVFISIDLVDADRASEMKKDIEAFIEAVKSKYFQPKVDKEALKGAL